MYCFKGKIQTLIHFKFNYKYYRSGMIVRQFMPVTCNLLQGHGKNERKRRAESGKQSKESSVLLRRELSQAEERHLICQVKISEE